MKIEKYEHGYRVNGTLPNGKRVRKRLRGLTREQTVAWVERQKREAGNEVASGVSAGRKVTFREAAESWMAEGRYLAGIEKAVAQLGKRPVDAITNGDVIRFARAHYKTNAAINRNGIAPVRAVLNHAHNMEWRATPMSMRMMRETPRKKPVASIEWLDAFVRQARGMGWRYLGYGELAILMYLTGRRVGEMVKLRWDGVEWDKRRILLERTKNGEEYWCAIPEPLVAPLRVLRAEQARLVEGGPGCFEGVTPETCERMGSGLIFGVRTKRSVWARWAEVCEAARIEHITPHASGRHSFATRLNEEGWSANDIAAAGGWKSVALVQRVYIHSERDSARAAHAMARGAGLLPIEG